MPAPAFPSLAESLPWLAAAHRGDCYTGDLHPPGALHAAFVRAAHPHAEILGIETGPARHPDVVAVWTADDLPASLSPIPCIVPIVNRDGTSRADPPRTLMAADRCRHQGEVLAMVVARSEQAARLAAARVQVRYRPLPAVCDAEQAIAAAAPAVWQEAPGNQCFDWELGDPAERDRVFARARHIVRRRLRNNRIIISPMETRNAIAACVPGRDARVLVSATQGAHWVRDIIARDVLHWPAERLEVITPRVGGSFGTKIFVYPEQVLTLIAADRLQATVKWSATRTEACLADIQGRDNHTDAALALDGDGRILGIATDTLANLGAFLSNYGPFSSTTCGAPLLCGPYRIGTVYARVRGVFTHTAPIDSYRGAGRPEAHYVLERLIDEAARELKLDAVALRQRNLIDEQQDLPYTTATGIRIDSGMFRANMARALQEADHAGFAERRRQSAERGLRRGLGVANFLETNGGFALAKMMERHTGGLPRESARIRFAADGSVRLDVGTQSAGQDHRRAYARILADHLGLPVACIAVHEGLTDQLQQGTGTGGSKSMLSGSTAILQAGDAVIEQARHWLAGRTGRDPGHVNWRDGALCIDEIPLTLSDAARMAHSAVGGEHPFDVHLTATMQSGTYGNGCHVCELEADPATGATRVLRYVAVSDFGTIVSQADVIGQQCGGIAQGLGQALLEECRYDESGHLASADLGSYHLPQASDLPAITVLFQASACQTNRLGLKGCGEAAASAAPPAIMNALHDALAPDLHELIQMPATAQRVWSALRQPRKT